MNLLVSQLKWFVLLLLSGLVILIRWLISRDCIDFLSWFNFFRHRISILLSVGFNHLGSRIFRHLGFPSVAINNISSEVSGNKQWVDILVGCQYSTDPQRTGPFISLKIYVNFVLLCFTWKVVHFHKHSCVLKDLSLCLLNSNLDICFGLRIFLFYRVQACVLKIIVANLGSILKVGIRLFSPLFLVFKICFQL